MIFSGKNSVLSKADRLFVIAYIGCADRAYDDLKENVKIKANSGRK